MLSLLALIVPSVLAATATSLAGQVDQKYSACSAQAQTDAARAACVTAALPELERATNGVITRLFGVLEANHESNETARLLREADRNYPPSRDADCRLRAQVMMSDEPAAISDVTHECVYQANRARLEQYERFLGYLASQVD